MAQVAPQPGLPGRKLLLRLDDGSLIGDSSVLLNTPEGGAVLLEPSNAARVARAGQAELERLDRLLEVFRNKYPNTYSIPKSQVRNHNPYREEVGAADRAEAAACCALRAPLHGRRRCMAAARVTATHAPLSCWPLLLLHTPACAQAASQRRDSSLAAPPVPPDHRSPQPPTP